LLNLAFAHLLVVALPEEAFFRGYLQTALDQRYRGRLRFFGIHFTAGLLLSSVLFALGHLTTMPQLGRLAVFFPSLLFGVLRDKSGGIGAPVVLHAQCNIFSAILGQGYGLY
jgi:membrane protease YdiL (CAAX protease family)